MNAKTIFAHESGDTFQMERSLVRVGRDRTAHARKPVPVVSEATRFHELKMAGEHNIDGRSWVEAVAMTILVACHEATPADWRAEHPDAVY